MGDGQDPLGKYDPAPKPGCSSRAPTADRWQDQGLVYVYDPSNGFNKPTADFLKARGTTTSASTSSSRPFRTPSSSRGALERQYVLSRDGWKADYNYPQDWFDNLWGHVVGCPDSNCTTGYDTKAYDSLVDKADAETGDQAIADYQKLNQMLIDDVAYIRSTTRTAPTCSSRMSRERAQNNFFEYHWNEIQLTAH